jgi:tRNA-guanine family transglycosylase
VRWAHRCREAKTRKDQALFAIVQGGMSTELRHACLERLTEMDFPGYALGGLSVGEPREAMLEVAAACLPQLPVDKPRYVMGVGTPEDLVDLVGLGDCAPVIRAGITVGRIYVICLWPRKFWPIGSIPFTICGISWS